MTNLTCSITWEPLKPFEKQRISPPVLRNSIRKRFHTPNDSSLILPDKKIKDSYLKFGFKSEKEDFEEQGLFLRKTAPLPFQRR